MSSNKLTRDIPSSFVGLSNADYMYFTRNVLTGAVPDWMLKRGDNYDLSYNNFTSESSRGCQEWSVNLFGSLLEEVNPHVAYWHSPRLTRTCHATLKDFHCGCHSRLHLF